MRARQVSAPLSYKFLTSTKPLTAKDAQRAVDAAIAAVAAGVFVTGATGEAEPIEIGFGTNMQDGGTIHVDAEFPVGMGAVILNGARIGKAR